MDGRTTNDPPLLVKKASGYIAVLGFVICIWLLISTCVSRAIVAQVKSPDGSLFATITEVNGATTDVRYEVDVSRNWPLLWHGSVADFYGAVRSDCAHGVIVNWIGDRTLLISYKSAKSADAHSSADALGQTVQIITRAGVNDPSTPCGGMEYRQRSRIAYGR